MVKVFLNTGIEFEIEAIESETADDYITNCIKKFGNWEPNVTEKFVMILDKALQNNIDGPILDVGACFGYYSLLAGIKGFKVYAFEPNPSVFPLLKRNSSRGPIGKIIINNFALGSNNCFIPISTPQNNIGGAYLKKNEIKGDQLVEVKRLDEFEFPLRITVLKIDAEGFEIEIIKGALQTLKQNQIDFIFIEISPKFLAITEVVDVIFKPLWKIGYLSFDIGLQDSGEMKDALRTFLPFSDEAFLSKHLSNIGQTNFLFVKKEEIKSKFITGSFWKDELLQEWMFQSFHDCYYKLKAKDSILDDMVQLTDSLKFENRKLFDELLKASNYQKELLQIIRDLEQVKK